jgi:hypothetical protein
MIVAVAIMFMANVCMFIALLKMNKARRLARFGAKREQIAWGRVMYAKGYKDCQEFKDFNPYQTYNDIMAEQMAEAFVEACK